MHNYYYYSRNIQTNVTDIIHVNASSFLFSLLYFIYHILLPLHRASDIRDRRI